MTREQLKAAGYVEVSYGEWVKPSLGTVAATSPEPRQTEHDSASSMEMLRGAKRIRQSTKPLLNKLETEFWETLKHRFQIVCPQGMRFRLANGLWYKPDFICAPLGFDSADVRLRAFEVKGPHAFRGGFENLKMAASLYPWIRWTLVWKENSDWKEQAVLP